MMAMWTTFNIDDEDFSKFVPGVANQPKFRLEKDGLSSLLCQAPCR